MQFKCSAMKNRKKLCIRLLILALSSIIIISYPFLPRPLMGQETTAGGAEAAPACGKITLGGIEAPEEEAADEVEQEVVEYGTIEEGVEVQPSAQPDVQPTATGLDECRSQFGEQDSDSDGIEDCLDNCPADYNPDQADTNADGFGDACEYEKLDMCDSGLLPAEQCQ